jgi:anaerobic selenocysteine-containing dehydrogenase
LGRLKTPLKRVAGRGEGRWERVSWSDAIELIRDRFTKIKEEHGARSVVFGQGMPKGPELFALVLLANVSDPLMFSLLRMCVMPS